MLPRASALFSGLSGFQFKLMYLNSLKEQEALTVLKIWWFLWNIFRFRYENYFGSALFLVLRGVFSDVLYEGGVINGKKKKSSNAK